MPSVPGVGVPALTIGVLALQGAFSAHQRVLQQLGADAVQVRTPAELARVHALVMPGGESTTMSRLLRTAGLLEPLAQRLHESMPVFGTCAGMILLARDVLDGRPDQKSFASIDIAVRRNGYGRQVDSFERDIEVHPAAPDSSSFHSSSFHSTSFHVPFHAVFIRAPKVETVGDGVQVLASLDGTPVLAQQGSVLVASFHPELTDDPRLHAMFLHMVHTARAHAA